MARRALALTASLETLPSAEVEASTAAEPLGSLEVLYRAHARAVARFLARLDGPRPDLEDLVHDVFLRADADRARFRAASTVRTWLFGIAYNLLRARRRRERLRRFLLREHAPTLAPPAAPSPDATLDAAGAWRTLAPALAALPEHERVVLVLFELESASGAEIAAALGVKPATVWVRLHRARARLRALLETSGGAR